VGSENMLDSAAVIERELTRPAVGSGGAERLETERGPRVRHRVDGSECRQPLCAGRTRREKEPDQESGLGGEAEGGHGGKKIARLTNPRTCPYVGSMIQSNSGWFFYFTNAGAARGPSGVGSVV
jgi:hypothetical protein